MVLMAMEREEQTSREAVCLKSFVLRKEERGAAHRPLRYGEWCSLPLSLWAVKLLSSLPLSLCVGVC